MVSTHDAYFKVIGQTFNNLTENGRPVEFLSKGHKARWMREHHVAEAGDTVKGSRSWIADKESKPKTDRAQIKDAIAKARAQLRYGRAR